MARAAAFSRARAPHAGLPARTLGRAVSLVVRNFERPTRRPLVERESRGQRQAVDTLPSACRHRIYPLSTTSRPASFPHLQRLLLAALDRVCARAHRNSRLCRCTVGGAVRAHPSACVPVCTFRSMHDLHDCWSSKRRPHACGKILCCPLARAAAPDTKVLRPVCLYFGLVFYVPDLLKDRDGFKLRLPFAAWNLILAM